MIGCLFVTFICVDADLKSHMSNSAPSATPVSYGFQGTSKKIDIPNGRVGVIIGKGGETIKYLQLQSGAKIQVTRDMDADPNSATRTVDLMGTPDQIAKAEQLINDVLSEVCFSFQTACVLLIKLLCQLLCVVSPRKNIDMPCSNGFVWKGLTNFSTANIILLAIFSL